MDFAERLNNIYLIDTKMFGFERYNAAYLVEGEEIALVDTGGCDRLEAVRQGIKAHGFSPSDISYIFITHSHSDHCGNVAPLLRESPDAKVYIHPRGSENLTDPSIAQAIRKKVYSPEMFARFADMEPVPPSRIQYLNDGDIFDLGNGEILRIIFAPGHQPDGIVILEEKNRGLFINDLVGNYLPDADAHYALNPPKSDSKQAIESLEKLLHVPVAYLYLGHYGICDRPKQVIARAINFMQQLLEIGIKYMGEGKPESIADKVLEIIMPELEKLRPARGEALYQYASREHVSSQVKIFAEYCLEKFGK
ncbi:MAG: MBL fold metallo-hydrolase [Proteobacteria bacterium]|nr:MBL fold metallo-hydrolase [Pseudomonadota bacterium]